MLNYIVEYQHFLFVCRISQDWKKSKQWKKFLDSRTKQIGDNHREDWYHLQVDGRLPLDLESDNADSGDDDEEHHLIGHDSEGRSIYVI